MKCSYKRPNRSVVERVFTYNVGNRLTEVAQRTTSGGRVTTRVINRNVFRGDGQRIFRDMNDRHMSYIYRDGTVLYTKERGMLFNFYYRAPNSDIMAIRHDTNFSTVSSTITTDIRGSTLSIFDDSRGIRGGFRYSDFGITQRVGWCDRNIDVAYTGGIWDEATGLYYLNARFYNPVDARFLQIDVARNGGDLRATLSLYGYTEGDPINKVDPTGYSSRWLLFNGSRLHIRERRYVTRVIATCRGNRTVRSFVGNRSSNSFDARTAPVNRRSSQRYGPTPPGRYRIFPQRLRTRANNPEMIQAMGSFAIRLFPMRGTNVHGRHSMHIHAGPWRDTAGCIRVREGRDARIVVNFIRSRQTPITVHVHYLAGRGWR